MFARLTASLLLLSMMVPTALASSTSSFNEKTLKDYFLFDEGTWWDYVESIDSPKGADLPDTIDVVDNVEDATHRTSVEPCKYANCSTYFSESTGLRFAYVAENGQVVIRQVNGHDIEKVMILDVNGFSGDVGELLELLYGVTLSDKVDTQQACELVYYGEKTIGGYSSGVIDNFCTLTFDYDDAIFGSTPTLRIVSEDVYMENVGLLYSEMKFYQDDEWQYTTHQNLKATSIDLIDLTEDTTTNEDASPDDTTSEETDQDVSTASDDSLTTVIDNPFGDLHATHRNYEAIIYLYNQGMINGYDDGSFKPNGTLNRAELLKILVEGKGESPSVAAYHDCFTDVSTDWYAPYVCYAKEQGWISGYPDGSFKPADVVNKVEALKMLLNSQGIETNPLTDAPYTDVSTDEWFAPYVAQAKALGILEEDGDSFQPDADRTRGSICENLYRLLMQQ